MRLDTFSSRQFQRGRPAWLEALWVILSGIAFSSWLPGSTWRCALLHFAGCLFLHGQFLHGKKIVSAGADADNGFLFSMGLA